MPTTTITQGRPGLTEYPMTYRLLHTHLMMGVILAMSLVMTGFTAAMPGQPPAPTSTAMVHEGNPADTGKQLSYANVAFYIAGACLGGYICVGLKNLNDMKQAARYFGVSTGTSLLAAPFLLNHNNGWITNPQWYDMFFAAGVIAYSAWVLHELLTGLAKRCKKAMEERGIAGVRDEIIIILTLGGFGRKDTEGAKKMAELQAEIDELKKAKPPS